MSLKSAGIRNSSHSLTYAPIIYNPNSYDKKGGYPVNEIPGFNSMMLLNKENIDNLSNFLNDTTIFDSVKLFFKNINECITSLTYYPFPIIGWQELTIDEQRNYYLKVNNISSKDLASDKQVKAYLVPQYLKPVKMVNEHIPRKFRTFLDYNPYTQLSVILPFYGELELNINDFLDKFLVILLNVDLKTGMGKYIVISSEDDFDNYAENNVKTQRIVTQVQCQVGVQIPLTSTNYSENIRNLWLGIGQTASIVATGVLANPSESITTTSSTRKNLIYKKATSRSNKVSKNPYLEGVHTTNTKSVREIKPNNQHLGTLASYSSFSALQNMYNRTSSEKNSGTFANSIDNIAHSFVIIKYPKLINDNFDNYLGKPCGKILKINTIYNNKYFKCTAIHINGTTATNEEISEIEDLLSNGVIK